MPATPTTRRLLQQARHCVEEALSVVEAKEDPQSALDDADQALLLLRDHIIPDLKEAIRG